MTTLLDLFKARHQLAKKFTKKNFLDNVKMNIKDYKAEDDWLNSFAENDTLYLQVTKRYEIIIPMIFTTQEGMLSSMFDRVPDILISERGEDDGEKVKKIKASYEYLKEKANLEEFMNSAAWWYLLTGFVSAHAGYVKKGHDVPATDEQGQEMIGEDGEPIMMTVYDEDDPEIEVSDPKYTFFSPESKYSIEAKNVPFYTRHKLMTTDDVLRTYGKVVKADASLQEEDKDDGISEDMKEDLERVNIIMYYGNIPSKYKDELIELGIEYDIDGWYYAVCTKEEILHVERMPKDMKTCRLLKWYGIPTEFFGFGIAKLLRPFQKEKSIRRTQQSRYADVAAFPKMLIPADTEIDETAAADPREVPILMYNGDKEPSYMTPPDLSNVLVLSEEKADQDAQQASGMLDISQGSQQSSTVDTATGQAIFAEAAEKRIRHAKRNFMNFYKECVILLLKLAQMYWDEAKVISLTDEDGNEEEVEVSAQDLSDVDFDRDISIDPDSLTVNKDVLRAQAIELYDRVKDDPIIDRRMVFQDMMRVGFNKRNPEKYMKEMAVQPGTPLMNPETGEQYVVSETGDIVSAQEQMEMAEPSGGGEIPTDPAAIMGGIQ